jgi:hypothetical protein
MDFTSIRSYYFQSIWRGVCSRLQLLVAKVRLCSLVQNETNCRDYLRLRRDLRISKAIEGDFRHLPSSEKLHLPKYYCFAPWTRIHLNAVEWFPALWRALGPHRTVGVIYLVHSINATYEQHKTQILAFFSCSTNTLIALFDFQK